MEIRREQQINHSRFFARGKSSSQMSGKAKSKIESENAFISFAKDNAALVVSLSRQRSSVRSFGLREGTSPLFNTSTPFNLQGPWNLFSEQGGSRRHPLHKGTQPALIKRKRQGPEK